MGLPAENYKLACKNINYLNFNTCLIA